MLLQDASNSIQSWATARKPSDQSPQVSDGAHGGHLLMQKYAQHRSQQKSATLFFQSQPPNQEDSKSSDSQRFGQYKVLVAGDSRHHARHPPGESNYGFGAGKHADSRQMKEEDDDQSQTPSQLEAERKLMASIDGVIQQARHEQRSRLKEDDYGPNQAHVPTKMQSGQNEANESESSMASIIIQYRQENIQEKPAVHQQKKQRSKYEAYLKKQLEREISDAKKEQLEKMQKYKAEETTKRQKLHKRIQQLIKLGSIQKDKPNIMVNKDNEYEFKNSSVQLSSWRQLNIINSINPFPSIQLSTKAYSKENSTNLMSTSQDIEESGQSSAKVLTNVKQAMKDLKDVPSIQRFENDVQTVFASWKDRMRSRVLHRSVAEVSDRSINNDRDSLGLLSLNQPPSKVQYDRKNRFKQFSNFPTNMSQRISMNRIEHNLNASIKRAEAYAIQQRNQKNNSCLEVLQRVSSRQRRADNAPSNITPIKQRSSMPSLHIQNERESNLASLNENSGEISITQDNESTKQAQMTTPKQRRQRNNLSFDFLGSKSVSQDYFQNKFDNIQKKFKQNNIEFNIDKPNRNILPRPKEAVEYFSNEASPGKELAQIKNQKSAREEKYLQLIEEIIDKRKEPFKEKKGSEESNEILKDQMNKLKKIQRQKKNLSGVKNPVAQDSEKSSVVNPLDTEAQMRVETEDHRVSTPKTPATALRFNKQSDTRTSRSSLTVEIGKLSARSSTATQDHLETKSIQKEQINEGRSADRKGRFDSEQDKKAKKKDISKRIESIVSRNSQHWDDIKKTKSSAQRLVGLKYKRFSKELGKKRESLPQVNAARGRTIKHDMRYFNKQSEQYAQDQVDYENQLKEFRHAYRRSMDDVKSWTPQSSRVQRQARQSKSQLSLLSFNLDEPSQDKSLGPNSAQRQTEKSLAARLKAKIKRKKKKKEVKASRTQLSFQLSSKTLKAKAKSLEIERTNLNNLGDRSNRIATSLRRNLTQAKLKIERQKQANEIKKLKKEFQIHIIKQNKIQERANQRKVKQHHRKRSIKSELQLRKILFNKYSILSKDFILKEITERKKIISELKRMEKAKKYEHTQDAKYLRFQKQVTQYFENKGPFLKAGLQLTPRLHKSVAFSAGRLASTSPQDATPPFFPNLLLEDEDVFMTTHSFMKQKSQVTPSNVVIQKSTSEQDALETRKKYALKQKTEREERMRKKCIKKFNKQYNKILAKNSKKRRRVRSASNALQKGNQKQLNVDSSQQKLDSKSESLSELLELSERVYAREDDKHEALEHAGKHLPRDFLLAQLSSKRIHKNFYLDKRDEQRYKEELRANSENYLNKADCFNGSQSSFNQMFESDIEFPEEIDEGLQNLLDEFVFKLEFLQGVKDNNKVCNKQRSPAAQTYQEFVKNALDQGHVPLPILLKIKKGILYIPSSYKVTEGLAIAMRNAMKNLQLIGRPHLKKAIFDKNNMTDKIFSLVLRGLRSRAELFSINSVNNQIGPLASQQICALLEKVRASDLPKGQRVPVLDELTLISNKCDPQSLDRIIETMHKTDNLKRLTLQDMQISSRQMNNLIDHLSMSDTVTELDISWNKLDSHQIGCLFKAIEKNKTIQYLNLGYIKMTDQKAMQNTFPKFCRFLKENHKLTHLNLTSIDLPPRMMLELIHNIKRSISLHVVHLCENNLSEKAQKMLKTKLKPTYIGPLAGHPLSKQFVQRLRRTLGTHFTDRDAKVFDSVKIKEMQIEWMSVQKSYSKQENPVQFTTPGYSDVPGLGEWRKPLILTKQLGHPEIHNSEHWKISNECYLCDKWRYTYIFWNAATGEQFQIQDTYLEEIFEDMIYASNETFASLMPWNKAFEEGGQAHIIGSFTNWQPRKMLKVEELCALIQKEFKVLQDPESRKQYFHEIIGVFTQILKEYSPYGQTTQYVYNDSTNDGGDFGELLLMLRNSMPAFEYNHLFVYCDFVKPGKHQYLVTYRNHVTEQLGEEAKPLVPKFDKFGQLLLQHQIQKIQRRMTLDLQQRIIPKSQIVKITSYHQFMGSAYLGEYNTNVKAHLFNLKEREFDRSKSVFKDWKIDTKASLEKGFAEETAYWKVAKFVKDPNEVEQITKLMGQHIEYLKTLFLVRASQGKFPYIGQLNYSQFVQGLGIIDQNYVLTSVDRVFIAVTKNIDKDLRGLISEKDMSRYQFYESIVRIAQQKYYQNGLAPSICDGLQILIENVLMAHYDNLTWMGWREDQLWNLDVDDLYKCNLQAMRLLYSFFFVVKKTKTFYMADALELFATMADLNLLPEQIANCWGMSKMTIENDIFLKQRYQQVVFVEFLEFFARLAEVVYKDDPNHKNDKLVDKIILFMDHMFPFVGMRRVKVQIELEYVSVSEDELVEDNYYV